MKITVKCTVCGETMLTVEGGILTQAKADDYQQNTSCDKDGSLGIVSVLEESE